MRSVLRSVLTHAFALALPPACVICQSLLGSSRRLVCAACWARVVPLPSPRCQRCDHPRAAGTVDACRWCRLLPPGIASVRSHCWVPEGAGGELVHQFKYQGWPRLAEEMARAMAPRRPPVGDAGPAVLVPVPLGRGRRRERGYNQAESLADALGVRWRLPVVADALHRIRDTRSQVPLTPDARSANVQGAFVATMAADVLRGTHVVLVDDVITTAATLTASADALAAIGPLSISFVTFGRARAAWDRRVISGSSTL